MTCAALVTAAGLGKRMRSSAPKQYLDLKGRPVLAWTLLAFESHPLIDLIVLTVTPGDEDFCLQTIVKPFNFKKIRDIVPGGNDRQVSVRYGLERLVETELVAIHDGVRPLVSADTITKSIEAAKTYGAAVACAAVRETVKKRVGSYLMTIPRTDLLLAHTPQTFRTSLIVDAHRKAFEDGFIGTDDTVLVERLGHPAVAVDDSDENIKITTPADMVLAGILLEARMLK
jgi:2-C-methyl-D-erythritol 4-phosphate cytidylyltransferase